ncbi:MAG: serine hydrolase domain-containing protein, partial [Acidobacteriota bacterium]
PEFFDRALLEGFDAEVEAALDRFGVPGASVVVISGDHEVFARGFGVRFAGRDPPMGAGSLYRIGGLSRLLSATALAALVDDGRLSWTESLSLSSEEAQLLDLAPSRSLAGPDPGSEAQAARGELAFSLARAAASSDPYGSPIAPLAVPASEGTGGGPTRDLFSAVFYGALAAGGQDPTSGFKRLMRDRLFSPAGMARSAVAHRLPTLAEDFAAPHGWTLEGSPEVIGFPAAAAGAPSAGVVSTAEDLGRFLIAHLSGGVAQSGKRVASERNLAISRGASLAGVRCAGEPMETAWPLAEECCLGGAGWRTVLLPGSERWVGGEGGVEGYSGILGLLPSRGVGLVVLANLDGRVGGRQFTREVRDAFLSRLLGRPGTVAHRLDHESWLRGVKGVSEGVGPVSDSSIRPWLGLYEQGWEVALGDGQSTLRRGDTAMPLLSLADQFVVARGAWAGSRVRFEASGPGRRRIVLSSSRGETLHRIQGLER